MSGERRRTKKEIEGYYAQKYPWLSKWILPAAAYILALDIIFENPIIEKSSPQDGNDGLVGRED